MSDDLTLEQIQALVTRAPFHQWLGLTVVAVSDDSIEIRATWREEWVVNTERGYTHGGILAALIDLAADWAMVQTDRARRADHRPARRLSPAGDAAAISSRAARSCAAARSSRPPRRRSSTCDGKLIASGRGTYLTAPPKTDMTGFTNLGDLIPRDRDLTKIAIIDLGGDGGEPARANFRSPRLDDNGERRGAGARSSAGSRAATASPSCRPIAPNISPPITASCAPASSRCR